jgi:hypothetical protein
MYAAKILADSVPRSSKYHTRLTTMEATFPRFILAEFNTHRMLSRNSASSRAIPVHKRIAQVWSNPFVPESFGVNKGGMQANAALGGWKATVARFLWILGSKLCCILAWCMSKLDVHKQHANRIIELWAWHTVVVSATEWENFFAQRTHKAAQPEMQIIAKLMRKALDESTPRAIRPGDWHLPYLTDDEDDALCDRWETAVKISVVRCAAVSYERQYADRSIEQCVKRHDEMKNQAHWSPFEHVAQVGVTLNEFNGNFRAPWIQYRKLFSGEDVFAGGES